MVRMDATALAQTYVAFVIKRISLSEDDILACVSKLSEEQLWHRGGDYENSVANLLLHLSGNLGEWVLHGIGGRPDVRERDAEFSLQPTMPGAEVIAQFQNKLAEVRAVIAATPLERLLEVIDPQPTSSWRRVTILETMFIITGHLQQHAGQIILLTKQMLATDLDLSMPRKR
jgi:uncharacterized damage-inducible protein DinB